MLIETICNYPQNLVMGISAGVGALAHAAYSIYNKTKSEKGFSFDWKKLADTTWQSVVAGLVAGASIGCGYEGILVAMVTGIGVDGIANKLQVSKVQFLNFVQLIAKLLTSADKKSKR